jgi:6-pyruvoyl-tetrahydropterin synthase
MKQWQSDFLENLIMSDWKAQNTDVEILSSQLSTSVKQRSDENMKLKILEKLRFTSMNDRFERIPTAYTQTYDWVFLDEEEYLRLVTEESTHEREEAEIAEGKEAEHNAEEVVEMKPPDLRRKHHLWNNFIEWLRSDQNFYWITGKPGSGKSTLMKFLHNDPRTTEHLQSWAGDLDLVTAGFFFWNSGTSMQMSEQGLIQSLVYQAAHQCPERIPALFPDRWRYSQLFGNDLRPWSLSELSQALTTLVTDRSKKYFFFIDGVDEFKGDEMKLASFLLGISSKPNVKMCVASRPWLVFEDAFQYSPSLRLEDLTAPDIYHFVLDNLRKNQIFARLQTVKPVDTKQLVSEVTEKAQGVFLWVHLVVMSLLEGLRDGDRIIDLQRRLLLLPSDLDQLFQKVLSGIDPKYLNQASKFFQLVRTVSEPISLHTFSFTEEELETALSAEIKGMPSEERRFRADQMRRRLNSRCKGLLEVPDLKSHGEQAKVQYLHRTVKDFLALESTGQYISSWTTEQFDADLQLSIGYMLDLKSLVVYPKMSLYTEFWHPFRRCIDYSIRVEPRNRDTYIAILNEIAKIGSDFFEKNADGRQVWLGTLLAEARREHGLSLREHWPRSSMPFLEYAARYPLHMYVEYRLDTLDDFDLQLIGHNLLLEAVGAGDIKMIKLLLAHKVDPNYRVGGQTTWQLVLGKARNQQSADDKREWAVLIEEFLVYGADPKVMVRNQSLEDFIRANADSWNQDPAVLERLLRLLPTLQKLPPVQRPQSPAAKKVVLQPQGRTQNQRQSGFFRLLNKIM